MQNLKLSTILVSLSMLTVAPVMGAASNVAPEAVPAADLGVMGVYTLDPAAGAVTSINSVKVTFPQTSWDGILIDNISQVTLTKDKGVTGKEEVYKVVKTEGGNSMQYCTMYFNYAASESSEGIEITAPGTYTLSIPAGTFHYDDWFATEYEYNGDIEAEYVIAADDSNPMSQAVISPAAGSTLESISEITLTFDTDEAINAGDAEGWGDITLAQSDESGFGGADNYFCVEASAEGNVVTLKFAADGQTTPVVILKKGEYTLNIPKGIFSLADNPEMSNDGMTAIYQIPYPTGADELVEYTLTPSTSEVTEISKFELTFPDAINGIVYPGKFELITLAYTPVGATDEEMIAMSGQTMKGNTITLDYYLPDGSPRTAQGTYTLTIPAGTFQAQGNPNSVNEEITMTYKLAISTGVGLTAADQAEVCDVYALDGTLVLRRATEAEIAALPAGIYIAGGRKICVK